MTTTTTIATDRRADAIFSPDGALVYLSDGDGIAVVDAAGTAVERFAAGAAIGALDVSPNGRFLYAADSATAHDGSARLFRIDTTTGHVHQFRLALPDGSAFLDIAVDNRGTVLVSGAKAVYTLDPATGVFTTLAEFANTPRLQASADGSRILIDPDVINDVPIAVYRAGHGIVAEHHDYYDPYAGASVDIHDRAVGAISTDGSLVFDSYQLCVYDETLNPVVRLAERYPYLAVDGAAFAPDGQTLYLFGADGASVYVVDAATWSVQGSFAVGVPFTGPFDQFNGFLYNKVGDAFEVSADGRTLKVVAPGGVTLVDLTTLTPNGGTAGDDRLDSEGGGLLGFGGDDVLATSYGVLLGGEGDDTYLIRDYGGRVFEVAGQGVDTVRAQIDYQLDDNVENLTLRGKATYGGGNALDNRIVAGGKAAQLYGNDGDDALTGGRGDDMLEGDGGSDVLRGGDGSDTLVGGEGDDVLTGGRGADVLTGQVGADVFRFGEGELSRSAVHADRIADFAGGDGDRVDLRGVDAVAGTAAVEHFRFVGRDAFSGTAGELRYRVEDGATILVGDTDGDGRGDAFLRLDGELALTRGDLLLGMSGAGAGAFASHPAFAPDPHMALA